MNLIEEVKNLKNAKVWIDSDYIHIETTHGDRGKIMSVNIKDLNEEEALAKVKDCLQQS